MRRALPLVLVLALLGGGYLAAAHLSGGAFPTLGLPLGGELGQLRRLTLAFWEDVQFKDFESAARYHAPEVQDQVDIPFLLERLFLVKPEGLDLMSYEVVLADIDSSGLRARVKTRLKVKILVKERLMEREVMLYWTRATPQEPWVMNLESSLRQLEAEEGKKH